MALEPGLYVAATPIGNLKDITYRAVETLQQADLILCEDTRQTAKLCAAYGVSTPLKPYHDHNGAKMRPFVLEKLREGAAICLVSDAGTPLISDPGYKLVRGARDDGQTVVTIPGPCAAIAGLSIAGAPSDRFFFAGFPPPKSAARRKFYQDAAIPGASLIFYETGARLSASLDDLTASLGERNVAIARELTKRFEEVIEGSAAALAARFANAPPKGEIVLIVHPSAEAPASADEIDAFLRDALAHMRVKDAASAAAETFSIPKKQAYHAALAVKDQPAGRADDGDER